MSFTINPFVWSFRLSIEFKRASSVKVTRFFCKEDHAFSIMSGPPFMNSKFFGSKSTSSKVNKYIIGVDMNKVENKICPYCDEKFNNIDIKVFANHVRWCKKNPKHDKICGKEFKEKISDKVNEHLNKKFGAIE